MRSSAYPRTRRRWRALAPGAVPVTAFILLGTAGPWLAPVAPAEAADPAAVVELPPGLALAGRGAGPATPLLGTDRLGRDVLSQLLHGARTSLTIAGGAVLVATLLGVGFGMLGAARGWVGGAASTWTTALLAFPRFFLLVALAALLPQGRWAVILILAATGWMTLARVVDGELRSLLERPFVEAARATGVSPVRLYLRHLTPHLVTPVAVLVTSMAGEAILAEAALSFLGLGVPPPEPSWGNMVADATSSLVSTWWLAAIPGVALTVTALGFQLLGDGLRDALSVPGG